jgi:O-antigen ligase
MAVYVLSQLLAAMLTPAPGVSVLLAAARSLFILALLTAGAWLGDVRRLQPLLLGLTLVFLTALTSSALTYGADVLNLRLKHPYYTEVSLGLAGAVAVLLVISWGGANRWARLLIGLLAFTVMALSGSRGALVALVAGALAGIWQGNRKLFPALLGGIGLVGLATALSKLTVAAKAVERLFSFTLTGRDRFWADAWNVFLSHPWGGVGPYQLGPYLKSLYWGQCQLWPLLERIGMVCPTWLERFSGAWIIAHNILLHQLGEAGVIGTAGLLLLLLWIGLAVWKARTPLLTAVFVMFMVMGLVDVPIAVPSLHLAEFFWVSMGIALARAGYFGKRV